MPVLWNPSEDFTGSWHFIWSFCLWLALGHSAASFLQIKRVKQGSLLSFLSVVECGSFSPLPNIWDMWASNSTCDSFKTLKWYVFRGVVECNNRINQRHENTYVFVYFLICALSHFCSLLKTIYNPHEFLIMSVRCSRLLCVTCSRHLWIGAAVFRHVLHLSVRTAAF